MWIVTLLNGVKDMFLTILTNEKMMPSYLIIFTSAVLSASLFILFFRELPMQNEKVVGLIVGVLIAKFGDQVGYFFNSSAGSAKKTDLMVQQQNKTPGGN